MLDFSKDPKTYPATLHLHQKEPLNAEPFDSRELIAHNITPLHLIFDRNHGPIPDITEDGYRLTVNGLVTRPMEFTLSDLKEMPPTEIVAALQVRFRGTR
jgi:sulfite oxidase